VICLRLNVGTKDILRRSNLGFDSDEWRSARARNFRLVPRPDFLPDVRNHIISGFHILPRIVAFAVESNPPAMPLDKIF